MENESTGGSAIVNWLARLTRKVTSGKIAPLYYGENLPPSRVADSVRDARSLWIILLSDSRFDIDGMFANCEQRGIASPSPAHNKRRIMFPCPVHNGLDSEAQAEVIRRSKLAQSWGLEVKWVDHEVLESMIIINPPSKTTATLTMALPLSICRCRTSTPRPARSLKSLKRIKLKYLLISSNHLAKPGARHTSQVSKKNNASERKWF